MLYIIGAEEIKASIEPFSSSGYATATEILLYSKFNSPNWKEFFFTVHAAILAFFLLL